jgi:hypothetical protein
MPPYIATMVVFPFGTKTNGFLFCALSHQHTAVCVQNMDCTQQDPQFSMPAFEIY